MFRPRAATESWAALNALLITELEADLPTRHLDDGRSVQAAWMLERKHLRAMPVHLPATCRVVARVADKFGHVRVDHETYSVPIRHAYRPVWVKLYYDRVAVAVGAEVVAQHPRAFRRGAKVLDARHVLPLLERKHRGRARGDGAQELAAGARVAAGASRAGQAHAQTRSGMGPDVTADGDAPRPRPSSARSPSRSSATHPAWKRCGSSCGSSRPARQRCAGRSTGCVRTWRGSTCPRRHWRPMTRW